MTKVATYSSLVAVNLLYACVTLFTKFAAQQEVLSISYCLSLCGAVGVMGVYAICWQQILKHTELSTAYMFKGTSLFFVVLLAFAIFGETITWRKAGAIIIIIGGVILFFL